jgi:hypothetical protein
VKRKIDGDQGGTSWWAINPQVAVDRTHPIRKTTQPAAGHGPRAADAVVGHPQTQPAVPGGQFDRCVAGCVWG